MAGRLGGAGVGENATLIGVATIRVRHVAHSPGRRQAAHIAPAVMVLCQFPIPSHSVLFSHHHVAPATGEAGDAVVRLDALAALAAATVAVALHPVVQQIRAALGLLRLDVGVDA